MSMAENPNTEHKRRVRYSGKYPKKYEEKYKELNPEKYTDIAGHVRAKGNTPAGTHIPIMVNEILEFLDIKPGQNGCDCTFGYGGHSEKMLECLKGSGHLVSLDVDPFESVKAKERLEKLGFGDEIHFVERINFAQIDKVAERYGKFDFVLADLGVSSMQIDNPERGFSYKVEGPLDLRMDPTKGISAAARLKELSEDELTGILIENADEPYAEVIAHTVISFRKSGKSIETTSDLRNVIDRSLAIAHVPEKERKDAVKKSAARCFQALRIEVNQEYEALYELLEKLPRVLKSGGKVAVLTFHSGEDRLVKQSFKHYLKEGTYADAARYVIRPSAGECNENPRARSTKMRWAIMK